MKYEPNKKSLNQHKVPEWFHNAKLGIFIHWGLYSVPAFAQTKYDIIENINRGGWKEHFKNNPYAEWYLNSLRIDGSPTQKYHFEKYGKDFKYDDFIPEFNKALERWDPNEMANLFKKVGARYVVLVTKHHDGFCLWPSDYPNPNKENYHTSRDVVGELTQAVKNNGLVMGFYYSGALDWSFNPKAIDSFKNMINNGPMDQDYIEYVDNHWYELINKYEPLILWNDIGYPPGADVFKLMADFYNKTPEGVVNDRWMQLGKGLRRVLKGPIGNLVSWIAKRAFTKGNMNTIKVPHCDYITPEYATFKKIKKKKWECTRGIGKSFGYNQQETEKDYISSDELIRMFIDIVSKNGNLLLNVGPMADGTIPKIQVDRLLALGNWLKVNGEAIFDTRPWIKAKGITKEGTEVRFTQKNDALYVILLGTPKENNIIVMNLKIKQSSEVYLLGNRNKLNWELIEDNFKVNLLSNLEIAPAYTFKIIPKP
ncbi:MAG: alpha-L-fucosidase [Candidatus Helarchaeota archaeon]